MLQRLYQLRLRGYRYLLWAILAIATTVSFQVQATYDDKQVLRFGIYESEHAAEVYRTHYTFIRYLESSLARRMKIPMAVEIRITRHYDELINLLAKGELDIVRVGPATMIEARRKNPHIRLLVADNLKVSNDSLIITGKKSGVHYLQDLKGRRFAFGSSHSTEGRYLAQAHLYDVGILSNSVAFDYLGRHDLVLKGVQLGDYAAGAIKSSVFEKNQGSKTLNVIARIPSYSKVWLASSALEVGLSDIIRTIILNTEEKNVLDSLGIEGFHPVALSDYHELVSAMNKAERFWGAL